MQRGFLDRVLNDITCTRALRSSTGTSSRVLSYRAVLSARRVASTHCIRVIDSSLSSAQLHTRRLPFYYRISVPRVVCPPPCPCEVSQDLPPVKLGPETRQDLARTPSRQEQRDTPRLLPLESPITVQLTPTSVRSEARRYGPVVQLESAPCTLVESGLSLAWARASWYFSSLGGFLQVRRAPSVASLPLYSPVSGLRAYRCYSPSTSELGCVRSLLQSHLPHPDPVTQWDRILQRNIPTAVPSTVLVTYLRLAADSTTARLYGPRPSRTGPARS